jgi:hypothetical protein
MRSFWIGLGALVWTCVSVAALAQQSSANTSQAMPMLQHSLLLLTAGNSVNDVVLTGTARRVAGSDDETGTVVLKALATGEARMDLSLPSGPLTEVWMNSGNLEGNLSGQWSGPDGVAHPMALYNLMTDSSWFFPAMTLTKWISIPGYGASDVGQETRNGETVEHITVSLSATALSPEMSSTFQYLSKTEIYLDSASGLPVALAFAAHPDNNGLLDIPVEIRLSDYRVEGGVQIPFHMQKYVNNCLLLDIQVESASINSGLTMGAFTIQ